MSPAPPGVWVAIAAGKQRRADEAERDLLAARDDDIGDEMADREDQCKP